MYLVVYIYDCLNRASNELMWCVLTDEEQRKCEAFAAATAKDQDETQEQAFGSYYRKVRFFNEILYTIRRSKI